MVIEVELPDGVIAEFPDDMSPDAIKSVLQKKFPTQQVQQKTAEQGFLADVGDFIASVPENVTRGAAKAGVGAYQLGMDAANALGLGNPIMDKLYQATEDTATRLRRESDKAGLSGQIIEQIGNPATYVGGGLAAGKGLLGLAKAGAVTGGLSGAITPTEEGQSRVANAAMGATVGAVLNPVGAKATDFIMDTGKGIVQKIAGTQPVSASTEYFRNLAAPLYKQADELGGTISRNKANQIIFDAYEKVKPKSLQGQIAQKSDPAYKLFDEFLLPSVNKPLTLEGLDEIEGQIRIRALEAAKAGDRNAARKLGEIKQLFREAVDSANPEDFVGGKAGFEAHKQADKLRAAQGAIQELDDVLQFADSYQQPSTYLTTQIRNILKNPADRRMFDKKEITFLQQVLKTGTAEDVLRPAGSRANALLVGADKGAGAGLITSVASKAAREVGVEIKKNAIEKVKQAITSRALGTPMPSLRSGATGAAGAVAAGLSNAATSEITSGVDVPANRGIPAFPTPNNPQNAPIPREPLTLEITPQSNTFTMQEEGFRTTVYNDTTGNPTIGYGFNFNSGIAPRVWQEAGVKTPYKQAKYGKAAITTDEAIALYRTSNKIATDDARNFYPEFDKLSPNKQTALIDLSYQLGAPKLNKHLGGLKKALKTNNKNAIIKTIRNSPHYNQTPERADRVLKMLITEDTL